MNFSRILRSRLGKLNTNATGNNVERKQRRDDLLRLAGVKGETDFCGVGVKPEPVPRGVFASTVAQGKSVQV